MATYDTVISVTGNAVGSLTTASFTVGSGSNRAGVAFVGWRQTGITVSSVTIATASAASVGARVSSSSGRSVHAWEAAAPASGSQTASVTFSDTWGNDLALQVITASDVDQTALASDLTTATGTSTTPSLTVPNVGSSDLVLDGVAHDWVASITAGADQTRRTDLSVGAIQHATSTQLGSAGGVMSWTAGGSAAWCQAGVRLVHAGGGGGTAGSMLTLLGVG